MNLFPIFPQVSSPPEALISGPVSDAVAHARKEVPELFDIDERTFYTRLRELAKEWYSGQRKPLPPSPRDWDELFQITPIELALRTRFWSKYEEAQSEGVTFTPRDVFQGICTEVRFYQRVLSSPVKTAFILNMPVQTQAQIAAQLTNALSVMDEIMQTPHISERIDPKTEKKVTFVNTPLMRTKVELFKLFLDRVHGSIKQTIDINQKSASLHMHAKVGGNNRTVGNSLEDLNQQIRELENYQPHQVVEAVVVKAEVDE
jgi:hypothetical protein